jgi:hypothetical protein
MERAVEASVLLRTPFERAVGILVGKAGLLLGAEVDLQLDVGRGSAVTQRVAITRSAPAVGDGSVDLPVSWRPVAREALVPSFRGTVRLVDVAPAAELRLVGSYRVPLGVVGRVGDAVVGHAAACRSLTTLVATIGARLDAEDAVAMTARWAPSERPLDLRDKPDVRSAAARRMTLS